MKRFVPLPRDFYASSADIVAPKMLGHWLIRNTPDGPCGGPIVETEAYLRGDPACHAAPGLTQRNRVMFGPPGYAYVYLIYGMHYCINAVCLPDGLAEAVLIRALEPSFGQDILQRQRQVKELRLLTNGPGKLCQAMNIGRDLNGVDLCAAGSPVFIARNLRIKEFRKEHGPIVTTTRIGITLAAEMPLRFYFARNKFVSRVAAA
jgi:DNA-3-methyladenine glycosylase